MPRKLPLSMRKCARCGETKPRAEMVIKCDGRVNGVCLACNVPPPGMKWCSSCKKWQPVEAFGACRSAPDGLANMCLEKARVRVRGHGVIMYDDLAPVRRWHGPEPMGIPPVCDDYTRHKLAGPLKAPNSHLGGGSPERFRVINHVVTIGD